MPTKPDPCTAENSEPHPMLQGHGVRGRLLLRPSAAFQVVAVCAPESHLVTDTETTRTAYVASSEVGPSPGVTHGSSDAYETIVMKTRTPRCRRSGSRHSAQPGTGHTDEQLSNFCTCTGCMAPAALTVRRRRRSGGTPGVQVSAQLQGCWVHDRLSPTVLEADLRTSVHVCI